MKVLVFCAKNGEAVIFGEVDEMPTVKKPVEIKNARMILYWDSDCGGIFGLASKGPKGETRITSTVKRVRDTCQQVVECSEQAIDAIERWPDAE